MSSQSKMSGAQQPATPFARRKRSVQKARGVNTTDRNFKPTMGGKGKNSWKRGADGIPTGWLDVSLLIVGHMLEHSIGTITRKAGNGARKFYYIVYMSEYPTPSNMSAEGFPEDTKELYMQLSGATGDAMERLDMMTKWSDEQAYIAAWALIYDCDKAEATELYNDYARNHGGSAAKEQTAKATGVAMGAAEKASKVVYEQAQYFSDDEALSDLEDVIGRKVKGGSKSKQKLPALDNKAANPDEEPAKEIPMEIRIDAASLIEMLETGDIRKACFRHKFTAEQVVKVQKELSTCLGVITQRVTSDTIHKDLTDKLDKSAGSSGLTRRQAAVEKNTSTSRPTAGAVGLMGQAKRNNPTIPKPPERTRESSSAAAKTEKRTSKDRVHESGTATARGRDQTAKFPKREKHGAKLTGNALEPTRSPRSSSAAIPTSDLLKMSPGSRKLHLELKQAELLMQLADREQMKGKNQYDPDAGPDIGNSTGIITVPHDYSSDGGPPSDSEKSIPASPNDGRPSSAESTSSKMKIKTRNQKRSEAEGVAKGSAAPPEEVIKNVRKPGVRGAARSRSAASAATSSKDNVIEEQAAGEEEVDKKPPVQQESQKSGDVYEYINAELAAGRKPRGRHPAMYGPLPSSKDTNSGEKQEDTTSGKDNKKSSEAGSKAAAKTDVGADGVKGEETEGPTAEEAGNAWEELQDKYGETYEPPHHPTADEKGEDTGKGETKDEENVTDFSGIDLSEL
eukprot:g16245.t1